MSAVSRVSNAFEKLLAKYTAANKGKDFDILTRPYYSSAAILFGLVDTLTIAGVTRSFAVASFGESATLFGYGRKDSVQGVGLGNRTADDSDTNQATAFKTNGEDVAIEGISMTSRGVRVQYNPATLAAVKAAGIITNNLVLDALAGNTVIGDPGSVVVPPEASSPLVLEEFFWEQIKPKMTLTENWNRKAVDLIGTADEMPEGGARSYLRASGEPTHHNFFRVPEGMIWQKEGGDNSDHLFGVDFKLEKSVVIAVTQPQGYQNVPLPAPPAPATSLGLPDFMYSEFKMKLHARAFYLKSRNI